VYGGVGCVAATANIVRPSVEIYEKFPCGDLEGPGGTVPPRTIADGVQSGSFPVVTRALNLLGFEVGKPILPNACCTESNRARLRDVLVQVGALKGGTDMNRAERFPPLSWSHSDSSWHLFTPVSEARKNESLPARVSRTGSESRWPFGAIWFLKTGLSRSGSGAGGEERVA